MIFRITLKYNDIVFCMLCNFFVYNVNSLNLIGWNYNKESEQCNNFQYIW